MLVTSSQPSTQRPLGLSVEELFALDRQYRRIEQQQHHLAQLQAQARITSSNLNRLASRSLDFGSSSPKPLTVLPTLEVHGHQYKNRAPPPLPPILNYPRSHSIDQLRYIPPPPPILKPLYSQRSTTNDVEHQHYQPNYRTHTQPSVLSAGNPSISVNDFMYDIPSSLIDNSDNRSSCKLRRQQPIKRESSRRILVRPVVHRRREPSISSSCESLDRKYSPPRDLPFESNDFIPSVSLVEDVIDDLTDETNNIIRNLSNTNSLSDDGEVNLFEMRVPIGKTYDTSDISVQLEGPKVLIYCHTIEPTDKRGNYRKHEFKTELFVPDVVDDETIVAYLTEDGQLIVEGKYHSWAWKEIKKKRHCEQKASNSSPSPVNSKLPSIKNNDGVSVQDKISSASNNDRIVDNVINQIKKLDNNRTVIHVGEPALSMDTKSISNIINRSNPSNKNDTSNIWDGQYSFTNDIPPVLIYHLCLPFETFMDSIRIQSDPQSNILKILIEQQEQNILDEQPQQNKIIIRSTSRLCRLPLDHIYDYTHLRVHFLKDNFIRIEIPTLN